MISIFIYDMKCTPCALSDEKGNKLLVLSVEKDKPKNLEDIMRQTAV